MPDPAYGWNPGWLNGAYLGPACKPDNFITGLGNTPSSGTNLSTMQWVWWPLILILVVIFIIWAEYRSQYCTGKACHQLSHEYDPSDNVATIINKLYRQINSTHTIVFWRTTMLAAIITGLLLLIITYRTFPSGMTLVVALGWIFIAIYGGFSWTVAHWYRQTANKAIEGVRNIEIALS